MLGNVEVIDTTRSVFALAGRLEYADSASRVRLTRDPAVVTWSENEGKVDSLYIGGDLLEYQGRPRCEVDSMAVVNAKKRLEDLAADPVTEYRRKAAEAAQKAAEEAAANDPNRPPAARGGRGGSKEPESPGTSNAPESPVGSNAPEGPPVIPSPAGASVSPDSTLTAPADSLLASLDSLAASALDSLGLAPVDSTEMLPPPPPPKDSTKVGFIQCRGNVRMFRSDIQMACDSLVFTELDSLIRMYKDPIVYNEGNRQYVADSIYVQVRNQRVEKASLMSNAFITTCEDSLAHAFDQIRGAEMVAYFDSTAALRRFDALGGASALFFLEENGKLATVNKVESKMLYATFADGNLQRIYYFEDAKNDAYPAVQLPKDERQLKGFRWDPDKQPKGPEDITSLQPRGSERTSYLARAHPEFKQTNKYFPGYINNIYKEIAARDALAVERARHKKEKEPEETPEEIEVGTEEEVVAGDDTAPEDPGADNGGSGTDTGSGSAVSDPGTGETPSGEAVDNPPVDESTLSAKERRRLERERRRAERQAAREARWAEQDRKYEERQAAKEQKRLERERARKLRALKRAERRAQREKRIYERYLARELARQAKQK